MKLFASVVLALVSMTTFADVSKAELIYKLKGKGSVAIIDCRDNGAAEDFGESIAVIKKTLAIVISNKVGRAFTLANASDQLARSGASVSVFIVNDPVLPMTLTASEAKWSLVNAAKLKVDNPPPQKFARRLSLLVVRQCYRILGSDESKGVDTCFHTVFDLPDLDSITSYDITMAPQISLNEVMELRGIEVPEYGTYEDACELGVAPKPTNAVQRAIWEKVHAPPKTPLKIKFDPAAQKGKVTK